MTDLEALKASITALDSLLASTLLTDLQSFVTELDALTSGSLTDIRSPMQMLVASEGWFTSFAAQLEDVNDAIAGIEPYDFLA